VASLSVPPRFDPELLYVQCAACGSPVLWEPGSTSRLLRRAGVSPVHLDEGCLLLAEACPSCAPGTALHRLHVVRPGAPAFAMAEEGGRGNA
jgi:hypothetical protein